jgi:hypothetical protein
MVRIETRDNDEVYITNNKKGDIKVNTGTKLLLNDIIGEVIKLESTTTPTITLEVISDSKQFAVDYPNFSQKQPGNFNENERILLMNDPFGSIEASSLDNTDKQKRPINSVKIYKDVEPIVISEPESPFPLDSTSDKWHRDDDYKNCEICKKDFGMFTRRKHHCRSCGRVVCNDCSSYKKDGHRVCNECSSPFATATSKSGGYKHRKNKSKRKNKRSLRRRRTSKRSNIRRKNKKVTKRLRKSRRRHSRR